MILEAVEVLIEFELKGFACELFSDCYHTIKTTGASHLMYVYTTTSANRSEE